MKEINNNPLWMRAVNYTKENLLEVFKQNNRMLDEIQKALNQYLESKRQIFSRFFFLSNNELLLILAEANRKPETVQPHLRKLFENINKIVIETGMHAEMINKIESAKKEEITLIRQPKTRDPVEKWLKDLELETSKALKSIIRNVYTDYEEDVSRNDIKLNKLKSQIFQVAITVDSINWWSITEEVLKEDYPQDSIAVWFSEIEESLKILTDIVRKELTFIERRTVIRLMTQDVHYRDIIENFKDTQATVDDFLWHQQLRYYYTTEKKDVVTKQLNSTLDYGYKYLGASTRLVITPLTDRCWMTITSTLNIRLGAAPSGPAGTGKLKLLKT